MTCSADSYILVWDFRRPPSDTGVIIDDDESETAEKGEREAEEKAKLKTKKLWDRLRAQTRAIIEKTSYGKTKYWSPAIGKYVKINSNTLKQFNVLL